MFTDNMYQFYEETQPIHFTAVIRILDPHKKSETWVEWHNFSHISNACVRNYRVSEGMTSRREKTTLTIFKPAREILRNSFGARIFENTPQS
jgi:hypothetical protein